MFSHLTLRAVSLDGASLSQPISARFDEAGGTIGRSDQNTMALPDPKRYISRHHARIAVYGGAGFVIENISKDNALVVRQQTLAPGESAPLRPQDTVRIGGYVLEVAAPTAAEPVLDDDSTAARPLRAPAGPRELPPLSASNPFASLLGGFDGGEPRASAFDTRPMPELEEALRQDDTPRLPPNLDLLGRGRAETGQAPNPFADMIDRPDEMLSIDALIQSPAAPPASAPDTAAAVFDRGFERVPELEAAYLPPRPAPAPAAAAAQVVDIPIGRTEAPAPPLRASAPAAGDGGDLWAAFCGGAGIEPAGAGGAAQMAQAGHLLRLAVEGTLQLMALRASTRNELHAQVTVIRSRENNPLKFSPDAGAALERLLQPPSRGFLPGEAAMAEAMSELVGHTIGTMAGMRAALEGVLERFTPEQLEDRLDGSGMLERMLPMTRKSRLWELYLQHYDTIREAAQEDFHALFGKAFLAAYEQQVERLRGAQGG